jgi:hypothetical protein
VFALNPVRFAVTETAAVPEPIDCEAVAVDVANVLLVPHSKYAVVEDPFGFTVPFNVAEVVLTDDALDVAADGAVTVPPDVIVQYATAFAALAASAAMVA